MHRVPDVPCLPRMFVITALPASDTATFRRIG